MEKINWNTYEQMFPDRYLQESYFDEYIKEIVSQDQHFHCLDIGGGVNGTESLNRDNCFVTALEPNCEQTRWDLDIEWDSNEKFNLIVARGSINYLNMFHFRKIVKMLGNNGTFIANSFIHPPSKRVRAFKNEIAGVKGLEMSLLYNKNSSTKAVKHYLIVLKDQVIAEETLVWNCNFIEDIENLNFSSDLIERVIEHEFYYYTLEDYLRMFNKEITFKTYNNNKSIIIRIDN